MEARPEVTEAGTVRGGGGPWGGRSACRVARDAVRGPTVGERLKRGGAFGVGRGFAGGGG